MQLLAYNIKPHNGVRLAELGFLLGAVAGAFLVLGSIMPSGRIWNLLAGIALGIGSVLLIAATRWGHFG